MVRDAETTAFYNGGGTLVAGTSAAEATGIVMTHCPYIATEPIQIINGSRLETTKFYTTNLRTAPDETKMDESLKIEWMNELVDELFI